MHTYFVITPGIDQKSYIQYSDNTQGNYIKFGEEADPHVDSEGIRKAYATHNPDIGVAAVMDSTQITNPYLGTRLKNYIVNTLGIAPVKGTSEWFSVQQEAGWGLWVAVRKWHNKVVTLAEIPTLTGIIQEWLGPDDTN